MARCRFDGSVVSIVLLVLLLLPIGKAWGQGDVEFKIGSREAWVGQSFPVQVEVVNAESHAPPRVPAIDGAEARVLEQTNESSFTQIVNGRVTRRSTITYTVMITPLREGVIEIPSIEVEVDGEVRASRPWKILAGRSVVGDLLFVEIVADPEQAWVGEAVELTIQVWVKQFRDTEAGVALDEGQMWELLDRSSSNWGIFSESLQQMNRERRRPRGRQVERDGASYFVYEVSTIRHPIRPGEIDVGDVRIVYAHPTGLSRKRDFFGRLSLEVEGSRPVVVEADAAPVEVRPLPETGRPVGFTGAVGRFRVRASASPTSVAVGDPVTLTIQVTDIGEGAPVDMANLRPPDLGADPALEGFRVPDSPTTGIADGRTKTFTETLRPERDDLTEIPGIAFPSFDPSLGRYVVERTDPISISVRPSERLDLGATVIGTDSALGPVSTRLTIADGTIRANRSIDAAVLGHVPIRTGWTAISLAVVPPVVFLAATVARSRRRHLDANPHLVRASAARRAAIEALESEGPVVDRVHHALAGIVAARLHRADSSMTPRELIEASRDAGLDDASSEELESLLRRAESARYGQATEGEDADLLERARTLLEPLDRLRPAEASEGSRDA